MKAIILAALIATSSFAWAPDGGPGLDAACACPEAPHAQELDGGWLLLTPERASRIACLMECRKAQRDLLAAQQPSEAYGVAAAIVCVTGAILGFLTWFLAGHR